MANRHPLLINATLAALGAAVVHAVGAAHEPAVVAALLVTAALVQTAAAVLAVLGPTPRSLAAAAAVSVAALAGWWLARAGALPWRPETLGLMDLFLPALEAGAAIGFLGALGLAWRSGPPPLARAIALLPAAVAILVVGAALIREPLAIVTLVVLFFSASMPQSLLIAFLPAAAALVTVLIWLKTRGRDVAKAVAALLAVVLLTWAGAATAADRRWFPAQRIGTVAYCAPGGNPLAMDLAQPAPGAKRLAPAAFYIHGGEGILGDRVLTGSEGPYFTRLRDELIARGFVVGSIDYRLAPMFPFTAQIADARCAVAFLRQHAAALGIDPARIGVYGDSEGGYLAAMLGADRSVQAVADLWGPTDLSNFAGSPSWVTLMEEGMTGGRVDPGASRAISPLYRVGPGDPPFLIIHGTADWFIAPRHSQQLAERLRQAGVPTTLLMVQGGGHGLNAAPAGTLQSPGPDAVVQAIADFFIRTLKP